MKLKIIIYFVICVFLSCSKSDPQTRIENQTPTDDTNNNSPNISFLVSNYLNEIIAVMESNSINKYDINWGQFRTEVFETAETAQTIEETIPAIRRALELLGDNHSFFISPAGNYVFGNDNLDCDYQTIETPDLPNNIGYVKVEGNFLSGESNAQYIQNIMQQISNQDDVDKIGWIIDLRNNGGGNMWPMITGLAPILGEGISGFFIDADGNEISWGIENGNAIYDGSPLDEFSNSHQLILQNPKVAVLHNNATNSSGEATTVAFKKRPNTKSFGNPTCGRSSGNQRFNLSNSSSLFLTVSYFADREMTNYYGESIQPDVICAQEDIISNAVNWLNE